MNVGELRATTLQQLRAAHGHFDEAIESFTEPVPARTALRNGSEALGTAIPNVDRLGVHSTMLSEAMEMADKASRMEPAQYMAWLDAERVVGAGTRFPTKFTGTVDLFIGKAAIEDAIDDVQALKGGRTIPARAAVMGALGAALAVGAGIYAFSSRDA